MIGAKCITTEPRCVDARMQPTSLKNGMVQDRRDALSIRSINWRKSAEYKAEDLRQLLIELDFRIQDSSPTSCRETLCKIEAMTQGIRNILAGRP